MRRDRPLFFQVLLGVVLLIAPFHPAVAQPEGMQQAGALRGLDVLLQDGRVQQELKLTEDQILRVKELIRETRQSHRTDFDKLRDVPSEERREKTQRILRTISEEILSGLPRSLKPEQVKRLRQVKIQNDGLKAFSDSEIKAALKLNNKQEAQIEAIGETLQREIRAEFERNNRRTFAVALQQINRLRRLAVAKAVENLDSTQKRTWQELTGEPFEIKSDTAPNEQTPGLSKTGRGPAF